nr:CoB--CoM heterodisulfide reductase iron-sulfur subunit B family protein [Candidatus Sigynarchaeota archaeon]
MSYHLYLGCVIPARLPYLEASARRVFEKLGIELNDIDGFTCCPDPTGIEQISSEAWLALGSRNLSLCTGNGSLLSLCSGCVETLKGVNHQINHDPEKLALVNEMLARVGKKYDGSTVVKHFAEVLYENIENIKKNIVKPLTGLKVAVHYGCHYLRPSEVIRWDDPFEPVTIDAIVTALGAESIPYDMKMECCGNPVSKSDKDLSTKMLGEKMNAIGRSEANCIAVVCPACYQQFQFSQRDVNSMFNTSYSYPVFYLSELVAIAFGINPSDIGINFHRIKAAQLLEELAIS